MAPIAMAWGTLVYHFSICFEEMRLTKRFGEPYQNYLSSVPRWIPRKTSEATTTAGRASLWRAARVEWQNLLLLLVPLGKEWSIRQHTWHGHALLARLVDPVMANAYLLVTVLAVGIVVLAAWNLKELSSARRRKKPTSP